MKEMTVKEICKELGYDVKIVKEKPIKLRHGDIVEIRGIPILGTLRRVIFNDNDRLRCFNEKDVWSDEDDNLEEWVQGHGYKVVGNIFNIKL